MTKLKFSGLSTAWKTWGGEHPNQASDQHNMIVGKYEHASLFLGKCK